METLARISQSHAGPRNKVGLGGLMETLARIKLPHVRVRHLVLTWWNYGNPSTDMAALWWTTKPGLDLVESWKP